MNNELNPQEFGLTLEKASQVENAFQVKINEKQAMGAIYSEIIKSEITPELTKQAGELRKKLAKVRTGIAEIHKVEKAFYLSAGRFVDAWKNKETLPITQMEGNLSLIEKHYEILAAKEKEERLLARIELLRQYSEIVPTGLADMEESVFESYLTGQKVAYEARIEAERKAEEERLRQLELEIIERNRRLQIAPYLRFVDERSELLREMSDVEFSAFHAELIDADHAYSEEQEQIRLENEMLKQEAEKVKAEREAEQKRIDAERAEVQKKLDEERHASERARQEKEKLEADIRAKEQAEFKAKEEAEKARKLAEKKAKAAPDRDKLIELAKTFANVNLPELATIEGVEVLKSIKILQTKLVAFIQERSELI